MKRLASLLLVMGMVGCGEGSALTSQPDATAILQPDANAPPFPDAATVKQMLTPAQLAVGDPIENSIGMVLVPIPAGEFLMGSPDSGSVPDDEKPQHQVTLTKPFFLGVHEVTVGQWYTVMGTTPWKGTMNQPAKHGVHFPAVTVSWDDAVKFCRKLSKKEGFEYRLPTEAEWEYACRAGTTTAYSFGEDASEMGDYAWYRDNSFAVAQRYAHPVGEKKPNPWGLCDMHGNVWEWCFDRHGDYPSGSVTDPVGPSSGSYHVHRGGTWRRRPLGVTAAARGWDPPQHITSQGGFRVALSMSGQ